MIDAAEASVSTLNNKMFAEFYVHAIKQAAMHNNHNFLNFIEHLKQPPVSIEEFIDSDQFMGSTDLKLWPKVREAVIELNSHWWKGADKHYDQAIFSRATGTGKCLGVDVPVLLYDGGIKLSQNINKGDVLMGPESNPQPVLQANESYGDMYRITPVKGESWTCNADHILSLKRTKIRSGDRYAGDIVNITVKEYLNKSKTFKHLHKQYRVGVEFLEIKVFDPYTIGLYLADGCKYRSALSLGGNKLLCLERVKKHVQIGQVNYDRGAWDISLLGFADIRESLTDYLHRRRIPKEYLINSRKNRLQLLAGILDGGGRLSCGGFDFIAKDECFADQAVYLCRSLGFAAYKKEVIKGIKSTGFTGIYYRVFISGDCHLIPTLSINKKAPVRGQKKDVLVTGFKVEPIGKGNYYGVVIGGDHRYLLGDFTVTHNTELAKITIAYHLHILGCMKTPQTYWGLPSATSILFIIQAAKPHVTKKVVYAPLRKYIETMPWFRKNMRPDKLLDSEMYFVEQNIRVVPGGADDDAALGEAMIFALIDEVNFMSVIERSKKVRVSMGRSSKYDQAEAIHDALSTRRKSRFTLPGPQVGMIICSSSTRYKGDYTDRLEEIVRREHISTTFVFGYAQYEVVPQNRFCGDKFNLFIGSDAAMSVRVMGDNEKAIGGRVIQVPVEYREQFVKNPTKALRDISGLSTNAISPFIRQPQKVMQCVAKGEEAGLKSFLPEDNIILRHQGLPLPIKGHFCSNPGKPRYVHIDLSSTQDRTGICMVRFDGLQWVERVDGEQEALPLVSMEMCMTVQPDHGNEVDVANIRSWIKLLYSTYGYPIKAVSYDGYNSVESRQAWKRQGMKTGLISVDRSPTPYRQLRDAFYDGRILLYNQPVLLEELLSLEFDENKGKEGKVDHSIIGAKDAADSLCGAYNLLLSRASSWVMPNGGTDSDMHDDGRSDAGERSDTDRH